MKRLETLEDFEAAYREEHKDPKRYQGNSIKTHIDHIAVLCTNSNIKSVIDYGCGQAATHKKSNLKWLFGWDTLTLYDPGIEEYSVKPTEPADLVLCIDVLEHIPEAYIDEVLLRLQSLTKKALYIAVSTRPASKTFPDGTNVHVTVKPSRWWIDKLKDMKVYTKIVFT